MNAPRLWSNILVIVGFIAMLIGAIDPLEGSLVILPAIAIVALGGFLGKSPIAYSFTGPAFSQPSALLPCS
jgi:hypothetical protein